MLIGQALERLAAVLLGFGLAGATWCAFLLLRALVRRVQKGRG